MELFPHFDKLAHFLMYMFFCTVLWYEYYRTHIRTNHKKVFWGAIISPIIFSGVMEILQSLFTKYRTGDIWDFLFNTLGVVSAAFFAEAGSGKMPNTAEPLPLICAANAPWRESRCKASAISGRREQAAPVRALPSEGKKLSVSPRDKACCAASFWGEGEGGHRW